MKLSNINHVNGFKDALEKCSGNVYLVSNNGDSFNLKSLFSQYLAIGKLIEDKGETLELFCERKEDEKYFFEFFNNNPDVL